MSLRTQLFLGVFPLFSHQSPVENFRVADREIIIWTVSFNVQEIDMREAQSMWFLNGYQEFIFVPF